jgi:macrolide transport system ATP-binding/permease protein
MSAPVIEAVGLSRTYHVGDVDVHALQDASLTVERGEFVAIMGSSGSGKSTLMSILGCLDQPSSGQYFFEGVDVADLSEPVLARIRSQRIGFVFQSFNLLARTSALENVALPLFYSDTAPPSRLARDERARQALRLLNLGNREENTPGQLSGGQQQRVAIARALINDPGLILADEPTGNLDSQNGAQVMELLGELRAGGATIVMVTHDPRYLAQVHRTVDLFDGRLVERGSLNLEVA